MSRKKPRGALARAGRAALADLVEQLGRALDARDWPAARRLAHICRQRAPDHPQVRYRAAVLALHGDLDATGAETILAPLAAARPDDDACLMLLAQARLQRGDRAGAAAFAERRIAVSPTAAGAYADLVLAAPERAARHAGAMRRLAADPGLPGLERARLLNALGRLSERQGGYSAAFRLFAAAKHALDRRYRPSLTHERYRAARAVMTTATVAKAVWTADTPATPRLVFITGMPRSGSTLIEQMLAAHADVASAGETAEIGRVLWERFKPTPQDRRGGGGFEAQLLAGSRAARARAAEAYLDAVRPRLSNPSASVWIDKMPANFAHLGAIALLFPSARFVMTDRDPRDMFLSCLRTHFHEGQEFTAGVEPFLHYYAHQQAFAGHWRAVLGARMVDMRYESVVADPEASARRLVAHAGLDWDPACALSAGAVGDVGTASALQVREQITARSVGAWRAYEAELRPLTRVLGADPPQPSPRAGSEAVAAPSSAARLSVAQSTASLAPAPRTGVAAPLPGAAGA